MNESLNHWLTRFVQTRGFIQKRVKWRSLWTSHWIIDSLDSFKHVDSFSNESSDGPYERVTESLTHSIRSNMWIHSETSQVTVLMNESLNHWLTRFVQTRGFIQKRVKWRSLWTSHWIIDSLDSFKHVDSFRNESSGGPYERVTESLTHSIRSNTWIHSETSQVAVLMNESLNHWLTRFVQTGGFIQKRVKWLSLWTSHWIIDSLDSFKHVDSFSNESSDGPYERVTESLTHSIRSNTWIHSETSQVTVLMNESLNHWLTRFVQTRGFIQ